ncbi:sulfotransferase [Dyella sp. 2HG41-7]|uniref:sulfotransferase family protein n=1 Tax=Dyella sp. 2HG41-7 TaxID=2883239 RepID=UPI001F407583|nr:sulfotransferase [Dyella sp. 2HG41-7]
MLKGDAKCNSDPIFVVGSPRSGTSILTWCLGQHANILPQEESGWLGEFAVNVGVQYRTGNLHGHRSQLSALGMDREVFFRTFGDSINAMILGCRARQERISRDCSKYDPSQINPAFALSQSADDPKVRWVDGTPEYSYYIAGLRKLFPNAKFVHIVRDVRAVVNSMLNFNMGSGGKLVDTEQQAYEYWLGTVQACIRAERAYGTQVVHRLRYDDLVRNPEQAMRRVLDFLGEPYMEACLQPLTSRINSSCVATDFDAHDPQTDIGVINEALRLSEQLQQTDTQFTRSASAQAEVEGQFGERVAFVAGLDADYASGQRKVTTLTNRLNWCGAAIAFNFLMAAAVLATPWLEGQRAISGYGILWFCTSCIGVWIYIGIRRAGLQDYAIRLLRKFGLFAHSEQGGMKEQAGHVLTHRLDTRKM